MTITPEEISAARKALADLQKGWVSPDVTESKRDHALEVFSDLLPRLLEERERMRGQLEFSDDGHAAIRAVLKKHGCEAAYNDDGVAHLAAKLEAARALALEEAAKAVEAMHDIYTKDGEHWIRAPDGDKRLLDLAPHLERQAMAEDALAGRDRRTVYEKIAERLRALAKKDGA